MEIVNYDIPKDKSKYVDLWIINITGYNSCNAYKPYYFFSQLKMEGDR